jgi:hypothetical protein
MHSNKSNKRAMHCDLIGFRYATNRWLALVGLSLIFFFLIPKDFPLLGTLLVRFYRRKIIAHNQYASIHKPQTLQHSIPYYPRVSEANKFRKQSIILKVLD